MRILLAVDGSEYSIGAAKFLTHLNLGNEDEITVLHVIHYVPLLHEIDTYQDIIFEIKQEIAPKILDQAMDILKKTEAKLSTTIKEGEAEKLIIDAAIDAGADIIVMGAKGLKGLTSFIVGSTTRSVVINSPISVLAIKRQQWEPKGKLKILFATDGSEFADAAAKFLSKMPFGSDSEITVMHVVQSATHDIPERFFMEIDDRIKEEVARIRTREFAEAERIIEHAMKYLRDGFSDLKSLIKVGDPSFEIISVAEKLSADIIVTGCRGLKGIKGALGSVSRNIMRHSPCSFLICKVC